VPSAAARALARALGALTGETAPSIAPQPVTQPAGTVDLSPAGPLASPDDAAVESANARRSVAAKGIVAQPMTDGLETPVPQAFAEPSDVSVEGALRKASAAAQGRELASAATPRTAEVTAPQTLGASILDAPVRVEGIAVQPAQGGQQASIGLAPAITDNGLDREGTVAEQLVKAVRIHVRDGIGEARLTLRPEHMGEVSVQLKIDKDRVSATLLVERSDVRAQIEGQGAALRAGLEAQGLKLEEFVVREDGERRKGSDQDGQREQSGRRRRPASDKSFDLNDA
jgi:flagellar hook-length control protein FliK